MYNAHIRLSDDYDKVFFAFPRVWLPKEQIPNSKIHNEIFMKEVFKTFVSLHVSFYAIAFWVANKTKLNTECRKF